MTARTKKILGGGSPQNWYMFSVSYCEDLLPRRGESFTPHGG